MPYDEESKFQSIFIPAPAGIQLATYDLVLGYDLVPLVGWLLGSQGRPITRYEDGYVTVLTDKDVMTKAIDPGVDFDADAWVEQADASLKQQVHWRKSRITKKLDEKGRVLVNTDSAVDYEAAQELAQEGAATWDRCRKCLIAARKPAAS